MTYMIWLIYHHNPLSCFYVSICYIAYYLFYSTRLSLVCMFVREYYFGLQIDFVESCSSFYIIPII